LAEAGPEPPLRGWVGWQCPDSLPKVGEASGSIRSGALSVRRDRRSNAEQ